MIRAQSIKGDVSYMNFKECSVCAQTLPAEAFTRVVGGKLSRCSWCKKCVRERRKDIRNISRDRSDKYEHGEMIHPNCPFCKCDIEDKIVKNESLKHKYCPFCTCKKHSSCATCKCGATDYKEGEK